MILSHDLFRSIDGRYTELVLSCTTSHVEATLLYFENNKVSKRLAHVRIPLGLRYPYLKDDVYEATYLALEEACRAMVLEAHELFTQDDLLKNHQRIHKVRLFIGGPWVVKKFHTRKKQWSASHVVTAQDIDDLLAQDIPQGHTRVANHVTATLANGYAVDINVLANQQVRDVEVSYIDIFARVNLLETLFQVLHAELNISESQFEYHATIAALAYATQENYHPGGDYLELFVHGAHADVLVHEKGHVVYADTLEWGYDQVVEVMLENKMAPSRVQAISLLSSYTSGHLHNDREQEIVAVVGQYVDDLVDQIHQHNSGVTIPRDWYIFADEYIAGFIYQVCKTSQHNTRAVLVKHKAPDQAIVFQDASNLSRIQTDYIQAHLHNTIEK